MPEWTAKDAGDEKSLEGQGKKVGLGDALCCHYGPVGPGFQDPHLGALGTLPAYLLCLEVGSRTVWTPWEDR